MKRGSMAALFLPSYVGQQQRPVSPATVAAAFAACAEVFMAAAPRMRSVSDPVQLNACSPPLHLVWAPPPAALRPEPLLSAQHF